jgi:hypothetical protein
MKNFHTIDLRERGVILSYFCVRSEIKNLGDSKLFQGKFSCEEINELPQIKATYLPSSVIPDSSAERKRYLDFVTKPGSVVDG